MCSYERVAQRTKAAELENGKIADENNNASDDLTAKRAV